MLFWISLAILVGGIVWMCLTYDNGFAIFTMAIGIVCVAVCLIVMLYTLTNVDGYVAKNEARYDSLVYQYENDIYDNDNDLGKRELMVAIQEWNEDLAWYREAQDDFWIGIFIPNVYDQFDYISLK